MPGPFNTCIYLFNSAPPDRPAYRRGVLDALAYPSGHQILMSYQRKYIAPDLLKRDALRDRPAAFVFLDRNPEAEDHTFIPIRLAHIVDSSALPGANRVEIRVELLELIPPSVRAASVRALRGRPIPYREGAKPGEHYYFVLEDTPIFKGATIEDSEPDIWEELAKRVKESKTLSDATILSLSHLRTYGSSQNCGLRSFKGHDKVYTLRPNSIYEVVVRILDTAALTNLSIKSSSDLLAPTQAYPTTIGGLGTYRVVISSKRSLETTLAAIFVDIPQGDAQSGAVKVGPKLTNSKAVYLAEVSPARSLLGLFVLVVFLGFLLTNLSHEFLSQNPAWRLGFSLEYATLVAKIGGAALLAVAAWLGLRKLPSGTSGG